MKEHCDNHCETCPMPTQVHCAVLFARSANIGLGNIMERLERLETLVKGENANPIIPTGFGVCSINPESEILPAQEVGGKTT